MLLLADINKSGQNHYWILLRGTARGGGWMKDGCTAVGVQCRGECVVLSVVVFLLVHMWRRPADSSQALWDDCQTVLIKQCHAFLLQLINSIQITNIYQKRWLFPETALFLFRSFLFSLLFFHLWQHFSCSFEICCTFWSSYSLLWPMWGCSNIYCTNTRRKGNERAEFS